MVDDDHTSWVSAADQQPAEHTSYITDGTFLRDPLFTCVNFIYIVVASTRDMQMLNKEYAQCQAQHADHLSHTHDAAVSTFLDLLQSSLFSCFREAISSFSLL